jgi:hypothetical protein
MAGFCFESSRMACLAAGDVDPLQDVWLTKRLRVGLEKWGNDEARLRRACSRTSVTTDN